MKMPLQHIGTKAILAITLLGCLGMTRVARADQVFISYRSGSFVAHDYFGTLDLANGQVTQIALEPSTITGLGFGTDGNLYGHAPLANVENLVRIVTTTGAESFLGQISGNASSVFGGVDNHGTQYFFDNKSLSTLRSMTLPSFSATTAGGTGEPFWVPLAVPDQCPPTTAPEHWSSTASGTRTEDGLPNLDGGWHWPYPTSALMLNRSTGRVRPMAPDREPPPVPPAVAAKAVGGTGRTRPVF